MGLAYATLRIILATASVMAAQGQGESHPIAKEKLRNMTGKLRKNVEKLRQNCSAITKLQWFKSQKDSAFLPLNKLAQCVHMEVCNTCHYECNGWNPIV